MPETNKAKSRLDVLICLIIAGEAIFSLPFHVTRYFRPTFLDVFGLSNAMLGDAFAVYGVTAMLAYFPGGIIADHFSARKLMAMSLILTSLGGFYLATIPSPVGLAILYGYWGITTILLFWAALIRTTREFTNKTQQGRAFGFLDGGRGLVAAAGASVAIVTFGVMVGSNSDTLIASEQILALRQVIYFYSIFTFATGVLCWLIIPELKTNSTSQHRDSRSAITQVLGKPVIWLQALIVVCAYCGYKGLDNYGLYAFDVLGMDQLASAQFSTISAYLRPVGAITAGFIADRVSARRTITILFFTMAVCYLISGFAVTDIATNILIANLLFSYLAVYALRGIYFALLEETSVSSKTTGTAVGLISVVGYTPDIFFASVTGRLLDQSPGLAGHQHYFILLAAISIVGILATVLLTRHISKKS